jgi:hypothetical protein
MRGILFTFFFFLQGPRPETPLALPPPLFLEFLQHSKKGQKKGDNEDSEGHLAHEFFKAYLVILGFLCDCFFTDSTALFFLKSYFLLITFLILMYLFTIKKIIL